MSSKINSYHKRDNTVFNNTSTPIETENNRNVNECKQRCVNNDRCVSFTHFTSPKTINNTLYPIDTCVYFDTYPDLIVNHQGTNTYILNDLEEQRGKGYGGHDRLTDYGNGGIDPESCKSLCNSVSNCGGIDIYSAACYFKNNIDQSKVINVPANTIYKRKGRPPEKFYFELEKDINYSGTNISSTPNVDPIQCLNQCNDNDNCMGAIIGYDKTCNLKSNLSGNIPITNNSTDTYVKLSKKNISRNNANYDKYYNKNINETRVTSSYLINVNLNEDQCYTLCNNISNCKGFTYTNNPQNCSLKSDISKDKLIKSRNSVAYIKNNNTNNSYILTPQNDHTNNTINTIDTSSIQNINDCISQCTTNNSNCVGVVYDNQNNSCTLKSLLIENSYRPTTNKNIIKIKENPIIAPPPNGSNTSTGDNPQGANSQGANSQGANSQGANSQGANSQGANSQGANSQGANSQGTNPPGANSQGANSQGANPPGANSQGANPPGANPPGANPPGANSQGANSQGTNPPDKNNKSTETTSPNTSESKYGTWEIVGISVAVIVGVIVIIAVIAWSRRKNKYNSVSSKTMADD